MSEHTFSIRTELKDQGLKDLQGFLRDIEERAQRITREFQKWQPRISSLSPEVGGFASGVGAGASSQPGSGTGGHRSSASTAGQRYDLSTVQGLENYEQQVFVPAMTVLRSAQRASGGMASGSGQSTMDQFMDSFLRKFAPSLFGIMMGPNTITPESLMPKTGFRSKAQPYSSQWYSDFFNHVGNNLSSFPEEIQQAFEEFKNASIGWKGQTPDPNAEKHFYEVYKDYYTQQANDLNQKAQEQYQSQTNSALASEFGAAIGSLGARYLPFLSVGMAANYTANQFEQGYQMWQQSSQPFDQLAHSIQLAGHDVEDFRKQVSAAGAQFGEILQQSAQSATLLTQSFGNLSQNGLAQLVGQTANFALQNGLTYQQATQITGTSATLGITSGATAQMSTSQFQNMISNMAVNGHMLGRQGEVATEYEDVASNIAAMNPTIANPQGIAYTLTQMNATGIQALQGMNGAQMHNQFAGGMMSPNQTAQAFIGAAIYQASGGKINNPLEWMQLMQEGPNAKITGTNITVGQAEENYLNKTFGNDQLAKAAFLQYGTGQASSINNAEALLGVKNLFNGEESTKNNQQDWYSTYDQLQIAQANRQVQQSSAGYWLAFPGIAFNSLGFGGSLALAGLGSIGMSRYGGTFLRGMFGGGGIKGGFKSVGSAIASDAKSIGSYLSGLGKSEQFAGLNDSGGILGGLRSASEAVSSGVERAGSFVRETGARIGNLVQDSGSLAEVTSLAGDLTKRIPLIGTALTVLGAKESGQSWGQSAAEGAGSLIGGTLGALVPIPGLDIATSIAGSWLGSKIGGGIYDLLHGPSQQPLAPPPNSSIDAHTQAHQSHNEQVRQASKSSRDTWSISTMTIDQLRINQLTMPGNSSDSSLSTANNNGNVYDPTSGSDSSSGGGFFSSLWNGVQSVWKDIENFFGFGGNSGSSSPAPTSLTGNSNEQKIANFLASKGLSDSAIAGIMGNLEQESNFISTAQNPSSGAYGIAQWLGSRLTDLDQYAAANHLSPSSLQAQLGYLWKEISSGQYVSVSALNKMSPQQAAVYFEEGFEKAGPGAALATRESNAEQIYSQLLKGYAVGGEVTQKQLAWIAEEGPEFIIPESPTQRSRALSLYLRAGEALGLTSQSQSSSMAAPSSQFTQVGSNQMELGSATINAIVQGIGTKIQSAIPSSRGTVRPI